MAVTVDAATAGGTYTNATSKSWTHTCAAGSVLYVSLALRIVSSEATSISITYNGSAMTFVDSTVFDGVIAGTKIVTYVHTSPDSGANTVAASWTNGQTGGCGSVSFLGADGTNGTIVEAMEASGTPSSTPTVTVSSQTGDLVYSALCVTSNAAPTAGDTERWNNGVALTCFGAASTQTGAASVDMDWSTDGSFYALHGFSVVQSGAAAAANHWLLMGV